MHARFVQPAAKRGFLEFTSSEKEVLSAEVHLCAPLHLPSVAEELMHLHNPRRFHLKQGVSARRVTLHSTKLLLIYTL